MPTEVIPRPSSAFQFTPTKDIDSRLMTARVAVAADKEDQAAGYAPTAGLEDTVQLLEAEYRQTYGIEPPQSISLMAIRRSEHLKGQPCFKST